jgi:hypothetical protein
MDGKGRCLDNVWVERLWRTVAVIVRLANFSRSSSKHAQMYTSLEGSVDDP